MRDGKKSGKREFGQYGCPEARGEALRYTAMNYAVTLTPGGGRVRQRTLLGNGPRLLRFPLFCPLSPRATVGRESGKNAEIHRLFPGARTGALGQWGKVVLVPSKQVFHAT